MEINKIIKDVKVIDYTHEGLAISKVDNQVIFIYEGLKDEVLNVEIIKYKNKIYYAKIIDIVKPSLEREEPICPHYKLCGGCSLQHMSYNEQLNMKEMTFKNSLKKAKLNLEVQNIKPSTKKLGYRNKITFNILKQQNNLFLAMKKKQTNELVKIDYCYLISKQMNEIKDQILQLLNGLEKDLNKANNSFINQLIIKENNQGEYLIYLKTNLNNIKDNNIKTIANYFKENTINKVTAIYVEDKKGNIKNIKDTAFIYKIQDLSFIISPNAFFQVNNEQMENIYNQAMDLIKQSNITLLDAYCGSGTIGQFLSKKVNKIVGIEINKDSIKDAKANANLNNISNTKYIAGDIQKVIKQIYEDNDNYFDTVVIDPPRKGMANNFINILNKYMPNEIIYISCQPSTLIRDIKLLEPNYEVTFVKKFDMFSQTHHVETVVRLERR